MKRERHSQWIWKIEGVNTLRKVPPKRDSRGSQGCQLHFQHHPLQLQEQEDQVLGQCE